MNPIRIAAIAVFAFLSTLASAAITLTPLAGSTPQTARPWSQWPLPIGVVATDNGTPVSGLQVTFALASPPFSIFVNGSAYTVVTDGQGVASLSRDIASAASAPGTFTFQASEPGGATAAFALSVAGAAPAAVNVVSGDNQIVEAGRVFPQRFVGQVVGTDGAPVPYANVSFQPQQGPGGTFTVADYYTVGDANGFVTAPPFTANDVVGAGIVFALLPSGLSRDFSFTIVPVPPPPIYTLTPVSGSTPQATRPNSFFPVQLGVKVTNPDGSPAAGVDVRFAGGPDSVAYIPGVVLLPDYVNGTINTTGADGIALASSPMSPHGYMALDTGSAVIKATTPRGLNEVGFQLSASGKPPSRIEQISGNGQSVPWGAEFAPWVVRAFDADGGTVPYAAIFYEVDAVGNLPASFENIYSPNQIVAPADEQGVGRSPKLVVTGFEMAPGTGSASLQWLDDAGHMRPFVVFNFRTGPFAPPVGLRAWATPPLSIDAGGTTGIPFSVRLTDSAGRPIAGAPVTFSTDKRCARFTRGTTYATTTDAKGIATSLPWTGTHPSTSCATSATAMGFVLDLGVHVFDPKRVVATASVPSVQTRPDTFYTFNVQFSEHGTPVHVPNFDVRPRFVPLGANYASTVADIFDDTTRLSFIANHQSGAYVVEFQVEGGKRLLIPVMQSP